MLSLGKPCLGYLSIVLLGQRVDKPSLTTSEARLVVMYTRNIFSAVPPGVGDSFGHYQSATDINSPVSSARGKSSTGMDWGGVFTEGFDIRYLLFVLAHQ